MYSTKKRSGQKRKPKKHSSLTLLYADVPVQESIQPLEQVDKKNVHEIETLIKQAKGAYMKKCQKTHREQINERLHEYRKSHKELSITVGKAEAKHMMAVLYKTKRGQAQQGDENV